MHGSHVRREGRNGSVRKGGKLNIILFLAVAGLLFQGAPLYAQQPFVGQIRIFAGDGAPAGWAFCEGQLLQISENDALFALIGTTYGGDGQTTFGLPDLRGRAIVGPGQGPGLSSYVLGQVGGVETVTLTTNQIPSHTHTISADSLPGSSDGPANLLPAQYPDGIPVYNVNSTTTMNPGVLSSTGGGEPHNNVKPYLAVRYIIALYGIFPARP